MCSLTRTTARSCVSSRSTDAGYEQSMVKIPRGTETGSASDEQGRRSNEPRRSAGCQVPSNAAGCHHGLLAALPGGDATRRRDVAPSRSGFHPAWGQAHLEVMDLPVSLVGRKAQHVLAMQLL